MPAGTVADLTELDAHSFPDLLAKVRRWQGWAPAVFHPAIPALLVSALGRGADSLVVAPELWADPLGLMVKVLPGMALTALVWC